MLTSQPTNFEVVDGNYNSINFLTENGAVTVTGFLFDLDGVLCIDNKPIIGSIQLLNILNSKCIPFRILTNYTTLSRKGLYDKLTSLGFKISEGTLGQAIGIFNPNISWVLYSVVANSLFKIAVIIALVYFKEMRSPTPYTPPDQPVFISQTFTLCSCILSPNISA